MVRALFRPVAAPGGKGALSAKVYYPALYGGSVLEKNTGLLPAARTNAGVNAPYPAAILMPGVNVAPEAYGFLAVELVNAGFVVMTYGWTVEEMPGVMSLSPGLDVEALKPGQYGTRPSATALQALIGELDAMNRSGTLAGCIDTSRILLGGHSAGGSVALFNARADWFPGVKAAFAYGAHSKASTMLGYPPEALLPLPDQLPLLVIGGSEDGVIAASAFRYGVEGTQAPDPVGPVLRTFKEAIGSARGDTHLAILKGANHFSGAAEGDGTTGRPFLDLPETRPGAEIRADLVQLVTNFARAAILGDSDARARLRTLLSDPTRVTHGATR